VSITTRMIVPSQNLARLIRPAYENNKSFTASPSPIDLQRATAMHEVR
jgi:hypothetical protein